jgi:hypothetical protein
VPSSPNGARQTEVPEATAGRVIQGRVRQARVAPGMTRIRSILWHTMNSVACLHLSVSYRHRPPFLHRLS